MKVLEIISAIEADKAANKKKKTHALVNEVITQYAAGREELKALEKNGQIKTGRTINDRYITIIKKRKNAAFTSAFP